MEIGLFFQLPAWPDQRPGDRYEDTLRQIELGDTLGFSVAWLAELHFESSRGVMPSPFLVAAAASQRTQRIGLGTAVALLPLHNPLRLAEETAMLDHLSGGGCGWASAGGTASRTTPASASTSRSGAAASPRRWR